jgi:hypothetical protein
VKRRHALINVMTFVPPIAVALWNFDGHGRISGFSIQNLGGQIMRNNVNATYTMDSEQCVANVTFAGNQQ